MLELSAAMRELRRRNVGGYLDVGLDDGCTTIDGVVRVYVRTDMSERTYRREYPKELNGRLQRTGETRYGLHQLSLVQG